MKNENEGRIPQEADEIVILIPVFNDWAAVSLLLQRLDEVLIAHDTPLPIQILLVDDGSSLVFDGELTATPFQRLQSVRVLELRRNLGHQRAIAIGLAYLESHGVYRAVVIMDGDGEDEPADILTLLTRFEELDEQKIVFAARLKRTESLLFRVFYKFYRGAHLLLTGTRVRVGNFSIVPFRQVTRLIVVSDLWNHYAAAVFKARLPVDSIPISRGYRLAGQSKMNFVSLIIHGLSAMSVYGDRIGVRLLTAAGIVTALLLTLLVGISVVHFMGFFAFPRWIFYLLIALLVVLIQAASLSLVFVFIVLAGRDSSSFLPVRDYIYFVQDCHRVYPEKEQR